MADRVHAALTALAAGRPVVVADDVERENEGDLIVAADLASADTVAFLVRHTSGLLCVGMAGERLDALELPPMVAANRESHGTAFSVSVDASVGVTTGISAADRARTVALLGDPGARPADFVRPGHVFPLRARPGGVLERPGHTEAAYDLARLAGRAPAGLLAEIVAPDGSMVRGAGLRSFAAEHGLALITIAELAAFRERHDPPVRVVSARLPTAYGPFTSHAFAPPGRGPEHVALTLGEPGGGEPLLVHVHRECTLGDVFGSSGCDCATDLSRSLERMAAAGRGALVYLRGGTGGSLVHAPGGGSDAVAAAAILRRLGARRIRLLSDDPGEPGRLARLGLEIAERIPLAPPMRLAS